MKRWWKLPVLPAVVFGFGLPSAATASTHCTVSIIMTTLGTDGTSVSQTITVPPNSNPTATGTPKPADPSVATPTNNPAGSKSSPGGGGGSGGGSGGGGGGMQSAMPTAASAVPDDTVNIPDTAPIPVPGDGTDEPLPPAPPVIEPPTNDNPDTPDAPPVDDSNPLPPTNDPTSEPTGGVAEAPEPGTLTLLGLAAIGGFGYARKKRKSA